LSSDHFLLEMASRVRERKTIPLFTVGCPHLRNFRSFCGLVEKTFNVSLPSLRIEGDTGEERLRSVKQFCGGLLGGDRLHPWHRPTARFGKDTRMSIAMSLFLYRKVLPSSEPDLLAYAEKMSFPSPDPDPGFLEYVRRNVPRLFPLGWDKNLYPRACQNATLPVKSCRQMGMSDGGARLYGLKNRWDSHLSYVNEVLSRETPLELQASRVVSVETGGKHRIVSVSDVNANLFRPLHTAMYNRLSRFPWLLRGEATPGRFREFTRVQGEVFVSGDYESATDNLNGHIQREILSGILRNCTVVPKGITESAPLMLRSILEVKLPGGRVETRVQERGQLMGNLLSFPLLCIVNYLAFRYYSRSRGPVRVNGDDIVFRGTPQEASRWMEKVQGSGLVLSAGKTMVNDRYFSLNSMLFKSGSERKPWMVPMIRSTAFGYRPLGGPREGMDSLVGRFRSFCPGFYGDRRSILRTEFLRWNSKYVVMTRRSCTRGLGLPVRRSELIASGLWDRECFYLSLPKEAEKPLPARPSRLDQDRKPLGWELRPVERITKGLRRVMRRAGPLFVECAWSLRGVRPPEEDSEWVRRVQDGTFFWGFDSSRKDIRSRARLLGLSPSNARRYLRPRIYDEDLRKEGVYRRRVWLPEREVTSLSSAALLAVDDDASRPRVQSESTLHPSYWGEVNIDDCEGRIISSGFGLCGETLAYDHTYRFFAPPSCVRC
jgi:hypothetical protein